MYHFIVNPASRSGRGKKYWNRIESELILQNIPYQAHISKYSGHTVTIVKDILSYAYKSYHPDSPDRDSAVEEDPVHLIILGGDGTVNEALQGIDRFDRVLLSYIPTGSSNDLARDLKISKDPIKALHHILEHPTEKRMDFGIIHCENSKEPDKTAKIPDQYFSVSCGIGYDAAICKEAMDSPLKNILNKCGLGKLTYIVIALKQLIRTEYITGELTLETSDATGTSDQTSSVKETIMLNKFLFLAAMNHKYEGGGFLFAPDADDEDEILNLCSITKISKLKILCVFPTAYFGRHYRYNGVMAYQTKSFSLHTSKPLWVHTDGEVRTKADYIFVKCNAEKIRFIY